MIFQPRRCRRDPFPKIIHSVNSRNQQSYIKISTTVGKNFQDMRAVCRWHETCTLTRNCRDHRPIGHLWAWLNAGPQALTKEEHRSWPISFQDRTLAREEFRDIAGTEEFFAAERSGEGEPLISWA